MNTNGFKIVNSRDFNLLWSNLKHKNLESKEDQTITRDNENNNNTFRIHLPHIVPKINSTGFFIEDLTESIIKSVEKTSIDMSKSCEATRLCHEQSQILREKFKSVYEPKRDKNFKFINEVDNFYNEKFLVKTRAQKFLPQIEYSMRGPNSKNDLSFKRKRFNQNNQDWMYGLYDAAQAFVNRQLIEQQLIKQQQQQEAIEKPEPGMIVAKKKAPKIKVNVVKEIKFGNEHDENEHPAVRVNIKTDEESDELNQDGGDNSFHIKASTQKSVKLAFEDILRLNLSTNDKVYLARRLYFHPHSLSFSSVYES